MYVTFHDPRSRVSSSSSDGSDRENLIVEVVSINYLDNSFLEIIRKAWIYEYQLDIYFSIQSSLISIGDEFFFTKGANDASGNIGNPFFSLNDWEYRGEKGN